MNSDTYENQSNSNALESYEWDRAWIDHPYDVGSKRILYIGDSISYGTRRVAAELASNSLRWDGFATSKAVDNPFFPDALRLFRMQVPNPDVLLFNNGLHGWHMDDEKDFPEAYEEIVRLLREEWGNTPIVLLLTTHVAQGDERVQKRNEAAQKIAKRYELPVLDLYTVSYENRHLLLPDGVHYTPEGYELLANTIHRFLRDLL